MAFPDFVADAPGQGDAIFQSDSFDGDEGNHVRGTHPRVRAGVVVHVDEFESFARAKNGGFADGRGFSSKSDDAAIVVGVHFAIEQVHARNFHGIDNGVNFGLVAAFGKIRNAFDQGHKRAEYRVRFGEATRGLYKNNSPNDFQRRP